nr:uncharacterized protein LOC109161268 [Ipomoea batatas]
MQTYKQAQSPDLKPSVALVVTDLKPSVAHCRHRSEAVVSSLSSQIFSFRAYKDTWNDSSMVKYLLSMYRKAFDKQLSALSMKNHKEREELSRKEMIFSEPNKPADCKSTEKRPIITSTSPALQPQVVYYAKFLQVV